MNNKECSCQTNSNQDFVEKKQSEHICTCGRKQERNTYAKNSLNLLNENNKDEKSSGCGCGGSGCGCSD